jgi:hypothetical protein
LRPIKERHVLSAVIRSRPTYIRSDPQARAKEIAVTRPFLATAVLAAILGLSSLPAAAQDAASDAGEKVNMIIIYGNDECPQPKGGEITVCARKSENERYRIPEALRGSESPQNDAWNNKVLAYEMVGRGGTLSCSPVGGGGYTGCAQQLIDKAYAEKGQDPGIRFSELIAAERERRLSTIDAEATATQSRVEQAEREYEARQQTQQSGTAPAPAQPATTQTAPPKTQTGQ